MALPIEISPLLIEELRRAPQLAVLLETLCHKVMGECIEDPQSASDTGQYRDSFGVDVSMTEHGPVGTVYNTDDAAGWVEFGAHAGGKTPVLGYHIMTRALDKVAGVGTYEHLASFAETGGDH